MFDKITYNAPVTLTFFIISFVVLIISKITRSKSNDLLFCNYRSSLLSPFTYIRLITHVFGHLNWTHFMNNFLYILLIGPMIEEKYGAEKLVLIMLITAIVTGIINMIIGKTKLLGASGIVFTLIVLSSFVNIQSGEIPLTLILICIFYIGNEIVSGLTKRDNVSHLGHLIGAICGCICGFYIV